MSKKTVNIMVIGSVLAASAIIFLIVMVDIVIPRSESAEKNKETIVDFEEVQLVDVYPRPEDYILSGLRDASVFNEKTQHYQYLFKGTVPVDEVKNYIQAVKDSGFTNINSSYESEDCIIYNATTPDDVYKVRISYYGNRESLIIIFDSVEELYVE